MESSNRGAVMLRVPSLTLLPLLALLQLLGAAHSVYVSLQCHRAGTLRRWEAGGGRGEPRLCKVAIPVTLDRPSEQAGCRGAGSGLASRRGRAGRAGRASFLVAGARGFRCSGPLRTDLLPGLCSAVRVQLRCARVFPASVSGERGVQAARGCERVPRAVAWGAILVEFGLRGALRKEKNGVRSGSCNGVTGTFAFGDFSFQTDCSCFSLATCWLLLV